jgi:hypothetical protein
MRETSSRPAHLLELEDAIVEAHAASTAAMRRLFRYLVHFDRAEGWRADGATSAEAWLSYRFGLSSATAKEWMQACHALVDLPAIAQSFEEGVFSWDQVRWIVQYATSADDVELAHWAGGSNAAVHEARARHERRIERKEAERKHRERELKVWWNRADGMFHLWGRLPASEGATFKKALDRLAEKAPRDAGTGNYLLLRQRYADAVVELASQRLGADTDVDRSTVVCYTTLETLTNGDGNAALEYGVPIASETLRRLACDARMQMVVTLPGGEMISLGRTSRTVPAQLLRVLTERDGECRFPGCRRNRGLHAHHVIHFADGGPTVASNLVLLCRYHHWLVHEGGWRIRLTMSGRLLFIRPDGSALEIRSAPLHQGAPAAKARSPARGP